MEKKPAVKLGRGRAARELGSHHSIIFTSPSHADKFNGSYYYWSAEPRNGCALDIRIGNQTLRDVNPTVSQTLGV